MSFYKKAKKYYKHGKKAYHTFDKELGKARNELYEKRERFKKSNTGMWASSYSGDVLYGTRTAIKVPTRYRFRHGTFMHGGSKVRERLGFRGASKLVEISFVPVKKRRK